MKINSTQLVIATALASILVSIAVALLTIIGEEYAPLKNWLKSTFTHHWIGKSALSVLVFVVGSVLLYFMPFTQRMRVSRAIIDAGAVAVLSAIAMTGYFILHTLHFV